MRPLSIPSPSRGPVRLVLAPLLGITTSVFRRLFVLHFSGLDQAIAPFLLVGNSVIDRVAFARLAKDLSLERNANSLPVIPQILSACGRNFAAMANFLRDEMNYEEVNWNIGCAAGTTPSRLRGAALLAHPDRVDRFLDEACSLFKGKISIKMRLGMDSPKECLALLPVLNRHPICEICVHPRTGTQHFAGSIDLEAFAEFSLNIKHQLLLNGDITSSAQAHLIRERFPTLAGLTLGRGVISNPRLPQAIKEQTSERDVVPISALKLFHNDLFRAYQETMEGGPQPVLSRMRELWVYWEQHFLGHERLLRRIIRANSLAEYAIAVERVFDAFFTEHSA